MTQRAYRVFIPLESSRSMFMGFPSGNHLFRLVRQQVHLLGRPRPSVIIWVQAEVDVPAYENTFRAAYIERHRLAVFYSLLLFPVQDHGSSLLLLLGTVIAGNPRITAWMAISKSRKGLFRDLAPGG